MTDRTIVKKNNKMTDRIIGGDWFKLIYSRRSDKTLQFYLDQFNTENYYIYKATNKFRKVTIEDLYEFKHAGYIFFLKSKYNYKEIDKWIKLLHSIDRGQFIYFNKPFPPEYVKEKIRIIR